MTVQIKTWDEMKEEFGEINEDGERFIDCDGTFLTDMEEELPKDRIIEITCKNGLEYFTSWTNSLHQWSISKDMIKRVINEN
ncbi:MAG: hypothetical protein PHF21_02680 [Bacilli bacterium]|nr:hypothetical protein [Bacilli bacterium]